jgi:hypothetical protein
MADIYIIYGKIIFNIYPLNTTFVLKMIRDENKDHQERRLSMNA